MTTPEMSPDILGRVDVDSIDTAERWRCPCGRHGFTMKVPGAHRRVETCPDCGEDTLHVWPSTELEHPDP